MLADSADAAAYPKVETSRGTSIADAQLQTWQSKLTSSGRAIFPWDELPEPKIERNLNHSPAGYSQQASSQTNAYDSPSIKQEGIEQNYLNLPARSQPIGFGSGHAEQRAQGLLYERFGEQANGSIAALQASKQNQGYAPQAQQPYAQYPQQSPYAVPRHQQSQNQAQQAQPSAQQHQQPYKYQQQPHSTPQPAKQEAETYIKQEHDSQRNGLGSAQTDGAGDETEWHAVLAVRNAQGQQKPLARLQADNQIRRMIVQNAQRLEGGGLMLPLAQRRSTPRTPHRTAPAASAQDAARVRRSRLGGDAADDDDDDDDADAINSDLDDPDDTAETNLEGVYEGDVILCLYDKVQRVKNKWKCVLREGILTIDDKE